MLDIKDVRDVDIAFGNTDGIMPKYDDIPADFKQMYGGSEKVKKCRECVTQWFFCGLKELNVVPKEGVFKDLDGTVISVDKEKKVLMVRFETSSRVVVAPVPFINVDYA